jgi:hypothetical protein
MVPRSALVSYQVEERFDKINHRYLPLQLGCFQMSRHPSHLMPSKVMPAEAFQSHGGAMVGFLHAYATVTFIPTPPHQPARYRVNSCPPHVVSNSCGVGIAFQVFNSWYTCPAFNILLQFSQKIP